MLKSLKAKLVSTCVTIGFIATLIGLSVSSYAWFSANKRPTATGMEMKVEVDTNLVDINFKLYKYDFDKKEGVEYIEGREGFNLQLNDFDNFIRERNVNNNNIIRFNVSLPNASSSEGKRKIKVSATSLESVIGNNFDGGFTDGVARTYIDEEGYKYHNASKDKDYICNSISNIIYFKGFAYSYVLDGETYKVDNNITIDESTPATIYRDATNEFVKRAEEFSFINGSIKDNQLEFNLEEVNAKASSVVFYVEYNYKVDLIDTFLADTEIVGSQDIGMMSNRINFMKDIEKISISSIGFES